MAKTPTYEMVTNTIIESLEKGLTGQWEVPWFSNGMPRNGDSGRTYNGINILLLMIAAQTNEYTSNEWFTYRQAQKLGGQVLKGQKATNIIFANVIRKTEVGDDGEESTSSFPIYKSFALFNRDQIEGLPVQATVEALSEADRLNAVDIFVKKTEAAVKALNVDKACYNIKTDEITIPLFTNFKTAEGYYSTMLHELAHWTGAKKRLDRDLKNRFGTPKYAEEELVAELTSAFLCAELGIQGKLQHPEYIKSWIKALKCDNKAIFKASKQAQKAAEYLKALQVEEGKEVCQKAGEAVPC